MTDIEDITTMITQMNLDEYNQYYRDERYKRLTELVHFSQDLDNPHRWQEIVTTTSLENLLQIPNRYCYKHFDDEDILYSRISLSAEKKMIIGNTYKNVVARKSGMIDMLLGGLILEKTYFVNDDKLDIFASMFQLYSLCSDYLDNPQQTDVSLIHPKLIDIIKDLIEKFQYEVTMNPLDPSYNSFDNIQLEIMIMINLAAQYLKLVNIWCYINKTDFHQLSSLMQIKYIKLINNYIALIFEIAFIKE